MKQKISSYIFLLTSILIGLGAFGHASQWSKHVYPAIGNLIANQNIIRLLLAVWLFVSGCMIVFGVLLIIVWFRIRKGVKGLLFIPIVISILYFITGLLSWPLVDPFFALFVVLGVLLFISALLMNRKSSK